MRAQRVAIPALALLGCFGALEAAACSSSAPAGRPISAISEGGSSDVLRRAPPDADTDAGIGTLTLTQIADTPCARPGGTAVTLAGDAGAVAPLEKLARVGPRWAGRNATSGGVVLFDESGAVLTPAPRTVARSTNVVASEGATAGVAGLDGLEIRYGRFDEQGAPIVPPITLASGAVGGLALGGGGGNALVVWSTGGGMHARGIGTSGSPSDAAFDFASGQAPSGMVATVAPAAQGFAIAWTADFGADAYRTFFTLATSTGIVAPAVQVLSESAHLLADMAAVSSGYVLLIDARVPAPAVSLVLVDANGATVGPARWLLGARYGVAVASSSTEFAVLAKRATGETELRAFNARGEPLGPWVCFAGPPPDDSTIGGLAADGAGYAAVYRAATGATTFSRVDRLGTGNP